MPTNLTITLDPRSDGIAVMHFTGMLDFTSAPVARDQFITAIAGGHHLLIVDLSKVSMVDSAGLGSLVGGLRAARQAGGDLRIANPSEKATMLISLTSLDQILQTSPTIEEALSDVLARRSRVPARASRAGDGPAVRPLSARAWRVWQTDILRPEIAPDVTQTTAQSGLAAGRAGGTGTHAKGPSTDG